jgi:hypothetical protein
MIAAVVTDPKTEPGASRVRSVRYGALVGTLAALGYAIARFKNSDGFIAAVDRSPRLFYDFKHYYFATAQSFSVGENEAGGYLYSPLLAIALMPVAAWGYEFAMAFWAIVQALALSLLVLRTSTLGPPGAVGGFLAAVLTLLSAASLHSLKWGQVGLILGLLMLESIVALARRREWAGALLLGSAIALKFYPAIVWPLAAAMRRVKGALGAIAVSAVLLVLPSFLVLGSRRTRNFYRRLMDSLSDNSRAAAGDPSSQAVLAWLRREFDWDPGAGVAALGVGIGLLALVLLYVGNRGAGESSAERGILAGLLLTSLVPFFVPTCWPLYFCALPALTLVTAEQWRLRQPTPGRAAALVILVLSGVAQTFPAVDMAGGWARYAERGWLLMANLAVVACALAVLVPHSIRILNARTSNDQISASSQANSPLTPKET